MNKNDKRKKLAYLESFVLAGVLAPAMIQTHEILGHWLPARILSGKNFRLGYTGVDLSSVREWSATKQLIVQGGGPLVTNLTICLGLRLLQNKSQNLRLVGWAIALTAYRGLIIPPRQILESKDTALLKTDETLVAEILKIPRFSISIPQLLLSIYFLVRGYRQLPENKKLIAMSGFLGMALGTIFYIKLAGPLLWPSQEGHPELTKLGLSRKE